MRACWLGRVGADTLLWSGARAAGPVPTCTSDTVSATVTVIAAAVAVVIVARFSPTVLEAFSE